MTSRASTTRRATAASAISGQAVAINSSTGSLTIAGSSVTSNTVLSLGVVTPGQTTTQSTIQTSSATITSVQYLYANNTVSPANAVSTAGGPILINGSGFVANSNVYINGTLASATFINSTQIRANVSANSSGTAQLTIFSPTGSGVLNTINYSGVPSWTTTSVSVQNGAAANVALVATSDSTLTFTLQGGSSLPTGLSLSSAGFITGTPTGYTVNTLVNAVIIATDQENQATQQTISFTISVVDAQFNYTSLLLNGENANTSYIADASANTLALTSNGSANPNRFSPLWGNGYYGASFDGGSGYLALPSSILLPGNFTVECWAYATTTTNAVDQVFNFGNYTLMLYHNGTTWTVEIGNGSSNYFTLVGSASLNAWHHFAITRSSNTYTLWIDGVSAASNTNSGAPAVSGATLNIGRASGATQYFTGYISNFRIVNGTAVYTSSFTPSTSPLTAVANTSLLTCLNNNFSDSSTNSFTVTPAGTVKVVSTQPFGALPSSITVNTGYSTYFNGTTDFFATPSSSSFAFGTNDFTMEAWIYLTSTASTQRIISTPGNNDEFLLVNTGSNVYLDYYDGVADTTSGSNYITVNTWTHVAVSRAGSTVRLFINGVLSGTGTSTANHTTAQSLYIGRYYASGIDYFKGYMSNLRIVKGTAVYTSTFTPSTTPLTAVTNTSLLTFQGSQISDASTNAFTLSFNGAPKVINNIYPFTMPTANVSSVISFGSAFFSGTGDYLTIPYNTTNFDWYTSGIDYTIEAWFMITGSGWFGTGSPAMIGNMNPTAGTNYWSFGVNGSLQPTFYYYNGSVGNSVTNTSITCAYNTWYHIAMCKTSSGIQLFCNGIAASVTAISGTPQSSSGTPLTIGQYNSTGCPGYISNIRIVKGTALYRNNFAPPYAPLTAIANTSLLTLQYKQSNNNNVFYDDSTNNFSITRNGTPTQGTFTPFSPTGWSTYFDGSTSCQVSWPNTSWQTLGGAGAATLWTVEYWIYPQDTGGSYGSMIYGQNVSGQAGSQWVSYYQQKVGLQSAGTGAFASPSPFSTSTIPLNTWTHVAITVSNATPASGTGTVKIYINGTLDATFTGVTTAVNNPGGNAYSGTRGDSTNYSLNGYISNFRLVTGSLVYTSNFTPPTNKLTAISGTAVLIYNSNRFYDQGQNVYTSSAGTGSSVQAFSPFSPGTVYSPTTHGGSIYFNGSSDYLQVPAGSQFAPGLADWTVEGWFYVNNTIPAYGSIIWSQSVSGTNYFVINVGTGSPVTNYLSFTATSSGGGTPINSASTFSYYTWNHFAVVNKSGTVTVFLNGVPGTPTVNGTNLNNTSYVPTIGRYTHTSANYFPGYLSGIKYVNGNALYTSTFTPPTAPPAPTANTNLLLLGTNAGIIDQHSTNDLITVGSTKISNSTFKYGSGSMSFNGSTDYLTIISNPLFTFGTGNFTVEAWIYPTALGSGLASQQIILNSQGTNSFSISVWNNNVHVAQFGIADLYNFSSASVTNNAWFHLAICRSGTNLYCFVNGVQSGSTQTDSTNFAGTTSGFIGSGGAGQYFAGYIDDLRVTKGFARYTANFTPSQTAFLTQ
jgi:hypothetical protein